MNTASYPTLDGEDERAYCYCYQGIAYKSECPNDYFFNEGVGTCYSVGIEIIILHFWEFVSKIGFLF